MKTVFNACITAYSDATSCQDYSQCQFTTINNNDGPICCTARQGCMLGTLTTLSNYESMAIRCDTLMGCYSAQLTASGSGGNIFAGGSFGAWSSTTSTSRINGYNITCSGQWSCYDAILSDANAIHCIGGDSCSDAQISNINTLYGYGSQSATSATISDVKNNVYCGTYRACKYSDISNIDGSIYGYSYESLSQTQITNVANNVIAVGYQVLQSSTINDIGGDVVGNCDFERSTKQPLKMPQQYVLFVLECCDVKLLSNHTQITLSIVYLCCFRCFMFFFASFGNFLHYFVFFVFFF